MKHTAWNPATATRLSISAVYSRSVNTYSCHHFGASLAAATSSSRSRTVLETTMTVPARETARAVALAIRVRELLVGPRRHGDRHREPRAEQLDAEVRRMDAGEHPWADHPPVERATVLRRGPLVPRAAGAEIVDVGRKPFARDGLEVVHREEQRVAHGPNPNRLELRGRRRSAPRSRPRRRGRSRPRTRSSATGTTAGSTRARRPGTARGTRGSRRPDHDRAPVRRVRVGEHLQHGVLAVADDVVVKPQQVPDASGSPRAARRPRRR